MTKGNTTDVKKKDSLAVASNKGALIVALVSLMGNVSAACKVVGISRKTYYQYYNGDEGFKEIVDEIPEMVKDYVESKLMANIGKGKEASIIFFAKTKMKDRGYIETDLHLHKLQAEFTIKVENQEDADIITDLTSNLPTGEE